MGSSQPGEACLTRPTALRIRGCTMGPDLTVRGVQSASEDGPRGRSVLQHLCAGVSGGVEGSQSREKLLIPQTSSTQYPTLVNPPHRADTGSLHPCSPQSWSRGPEQQDRLTCRDPSSLQGTSLQHRQCQQCSSAGRFRCGIPAHLLCPPSADGPLAADTCDNGYLCCP